MHLGFRMASKETDVQSVRIDCPVCGKSSAKAVARDLRQMLFLFYVVPVFYHSPTLVECPCGASLISKLKANHLLGIDTAFASRYLNVRVSPVLKTLVFGGLVAWLLPAIGTVWLGIAYWWSRQYSGWIRSLALTLFLLSLLPTLALFLAE